MEEAKSSKIKIPKKLLRIILRVTLIIIGLYFLLLVGLSIYISSSKERLLGFINDKLKETVLGELKVNKADITIWRSFPDIGITLENVSISDSFYHKPFLQAGEITGRAGFFGVIGNKVTINSLKVKNATIHSFTDAKGYTNTYVLGSHKSKAKSPSENKKAVVFNNLYLQNVVIILEDAIKKKRYAGKIYDADIDMRFSGSTYFIKMDEDLYLRGLGFNLPQGYWLENQRIQAKWKLEFDTAGSILTVKESKVKIQGHPFTIKGEFDLGGKSRFQLNATTKEIKYTAGLNILKPKIRTTLSKLNLTGPVDVTASLSGSLSKRGDPSVNVVFKTAQNNIGTPVLNLNDCNFSGNYSNQVNKNIEPDDSNSRIVVTGFTSNWGEIKLNTPKIVITNLRTPVIQFEFFTQCTMQQLNEALASSTLDFVEGNAKLYLAYNGPLIPDPSLLNRLNAKIQIQNGKLVYVPRNLTFDSCNGTVAIMGNNLMVNNLQCNLNTNHFTVNITGKNLNRFSDSVAGRASINCEVFSPAVNLADFKTLFAKKRKVVAKKKNKNIGSAINTIDNAIEYGDLDFGLKAQQVTLNRFKASNVTADILFQNDDWEIKKAYLQHADGSFNLTAKVHQVNDEYHTATIQTDLRNINVKKLFYAFDNFGMRSVGYNNIQGIMNSTGNLTTGINSAGKLVTSTMNGKMYFSLKNAALINFQPLINIQQYVFKNRNLNNLQFAELKDTFDLKNGDIYIHRMPVQSSAITMYIEGVYSFADRTDISIQVPLSSLKNKPEDDYKKIDKAKAEKPGASIYLRAKDNNGQMKISLDLFKKFRKNKNDKENN